MDLPSEAPIRSEGVTSELGADQSEIDLMPLKRLFDITDNSQNKNLEIILGWAQSKGITNRDDMRLEIRRLEMKLGSPDFGESRASRLSKYLILDGKLNNTLKEMQTYEK